jgi:S1-C subfamily serine protease
MGIFKYRGSLPPGSKMFRGREEQLRQLLRICSAGSVDAYAMVYGGRQTGKTSLLFRLEERLPTSICSCYIDFQGVKFTDTSEAVQFMAQCIGQQFPNLSLSEDVRSKVNLENFLAHVVAHLAPRRLVLLVEELGGLSFPVRLELANVIRAIFSARFNKIHPLDQLVFVLSGNLELYDLMSDDDVSPLHNVCDPIYVPDLGEQDAVGLIVDGLGEAGLPAQDALQLGQKIYAEVSGHPYLTQRLGGMVEEKFDSGQYQSVSDLDEVINELYVSDDFFSRLLNKVQRRELEPACRTLLNPEPGKPNKYSRMDHAMAQLELIGLAVRGAHDLWVIRNPLFERVMRNWFPETPGIIAVQTKKTRQSRQLPLNQAVVRILASAGGVVGAGFLIDRCHILTCVHVILTALGKNDLEQGLTHQEVAIDWPLVEMGRFFRAEVIAWTPPQDNGEGDIAVLRLKGPAPAGTKPACLVDSVELWEHPFRAFGFPRGHETGVWAEGVLLDTVGGHWIQVGATKSVGYAIKPGFSGTPVWDSRKKGVVGMVVGAGRELEARVAFIISSDHILDVLEIFNKRIMLG